MRIVEQEESRGIRVVTAEDMQRSYSSLNEIHESEQRQPELFGWEKDWKGYEDRLKTALGFQGRLGELLFNMQYAALPTHEHVRKALQIVPFGKYALPSERRFYEESSNEEKNEALFWEGVGLALWGSGAVWGKVVKPGLSAMSKWRRARNLLKMKPVEEAIEAVSTNKGFWKGFDFKKSAERILVGKRFGFAKDEAQAIARYAEGTGSPVLKALEYEKRLVGKEMSKAWKTQVGKVSGLAYGGPKPIGAVMDALEYSTLQSKHYAALYRENLKILGFNIPHAEMILKAQAAKFFGAEVAGKVKFATMSIDESANLVANMLEPAGQKFLRTIHTLGSDKYLLPWFNPVRSIMGAGEQVWSALSKVYEPMNQVKMNVGMYKTNKIVTFLKMLDERGFGTFSIKNNIPKFKPNGSVWTKSILDEVATLMRQADTLAELGRKGLVQKDLAIRTIEESLARVRAKSPVVMELVDTVYDYHNLLYKDLLTKWLPKVFHSKGLSSHGASLVGQLGAKLGPKIEAIFASSSGMKHGDKIAEIKGVLRAYRGLLTDTKIFALEGKKLEKATVEVGKRLAYGKEFGFPGYLAYYFPRMRQLGAAVETNWSLTLAGEAGMMRTRKLPIPQDVMNDLSKMIELRTAQMAKQLYFYDDVGKIVEYAKTLPQSWKLHVEGLISKAVGRPSILDGWLSEVLQKTPLGKNWDAYRAMRAARTLTGLQYSGLLGFRPFAVFRNLTQPYLTVGTDLGGGIIDHLAVAKGTAMAATKSHREYIKSIGAITEYVPEEIAKQLVPGAKGILPSSDTIRDAFMVMFKQSDRWNRYVTGGAAVSKWDYIWKDAGGNLGKFIRRIKLDTRQPWVRDQIENLLHLGKMDEAKAAFVKDVIADTQYLYGTLEAPPALGRGGVPKLFTSFNSWWMNYGHLIHKWVRTGEADTKVTRMLSFVMSSALVEQGIEWWAGRSRATSATFLGPFPLGGFGTPPALEPIRKILVGTGRFAKARPDDIDELEKAYQEMIGGLKAGFETFVPGGLQMSQLHQAYQNYGTEGIPKAILGRAQDEEFEPLWGALD